MHRPPSGRRARRRGEAERPARHRVFLSETGEQLIERQHEVGVLGEGTDLIEELDPYAPSDSLQSVSIACMVDQDSPHRFRRGREEVSPVPELLVAHQPQIGLVHERGGVQGVPGFLRGHPHGREFPQFVIDERKQVGRRLAVARSGGIYEVGISDIPTDYMRCIATQKRRRTGAPPADDR